jgi:hypothetical protein
LDGFNAMTTLGLKSKKLIALIAITMIMIFSSLRVYGGYRTEHDESIRRIDVTWKYAMEQRAKANKLDNTFDCALNWGSYNAGMQGVLKPVCDGDEMSSGALHDLIRQAYIAHTEATEAENVVSFETFYADSFKYKTRYLLSCAWAAITGMRPPESQIWRVREDAMRILKEQKAQQNTKH